MIHFLKYFVLTLIFFALLNIFRSNNEVMLSLHFQVPLFGEWISEPVPVFYLLLIAFCFGVLLAALLGAIRFRDVRLEKKEIKQITKQVDDQHSNNLPPIL